MSGACLSEHDFTFYSDLNSTAEDVSWENINPVEAMLGEGGLVSKYGAELARDWFDVFLVERVGCETDVTIREKKNLTGISYDVDETDVVTRVMPTGEDADGNIFEGSISSCENLRENPLRRRLPDVHGALLVL